MKLHEFELEEIIISTDRDILKNHGLEIKGKLLRQQKIGNYGISDLIEVRRIEYDNLFGNTLEINVIELKIVPIDFNTLSQAIRYLTGIKHYLRERNFKNNIKPKITLIGSSIANDSLYYINEFFGCEIEIFTFKYNIDGIFFIKQDTDCTLKNGGF